MEKGIILLRIWKSSDCSLTITQHVKNYKSVLVYAYNSGYVNQYLKKESLEEIIKLECEVLEKKYIKNLKIKTVKL